MGTYMGERSTWNESFKMFFFHQDAIPGLFMMGHANFRNAGNIMDMHVHDMIEIVVILRGNQQFLVDDDCYDLYAGDILMTFPGELHGKRMLHQNIGEFIWFQIDTSAIFRECFLGTQSAHSEYLYEQFANCRTRIKKAEKKELPLLRESFYMLASEKQWEQMLGYHQLMHFIIHNICYKESDVEENYYREIQDAVTYICAHLHEKITVEMLAKRAFLSCTQFQKKFREEMGMSIHAYIMMLKIDTAKNLLKNQEYSITDIAYMLNFSSGNHFSNVFKRHLGITPTDFKKRHLEDRM